MNKCENCVKSDVCVHKANIKNDTYAYMGVNYDTEKCPHYKDKSLFVELPCKVGDKAYYLTSIDTLDELNVIEIFEGKVCSISNDENILWIFCRYDNGLGFWHMERNIGKNLFFTKEEAERKLKEVGK